MKPKSSTGLIPLTDMSAKESYKGHDGGLYGMGRNRSPKAHEQAALSALARIEPLDADGNPSPDGKIVLMSIGMSNTRMAFSAFMELAKKLKNISPQLVLVNGSLGGQDIDSWLEGKPTPRAEGLTIWQWMDQELEKAGVTPRQVQVIWMKHAKKRPGEVGEFPVHAEQLSKKIGRNVLDLRKHLPNLRIAYLSSRTYGGYATTPLNPEPYAYESGFAVQWLIERQMKGDKALNYDPARGRVAAPVLLWGPYLWADGMKGRKIDQLVYEQKDFGDDGTHPSKLLGRTKIGKQLLEFFTTDPLAKGWFLAEAKEE